MWFQCFPLQEGLMGIVMQQVYVSIIREYLCESQGGKGTPTDKLRLALVFLLTCEALPSDGDYERVTAALVAAGADTSALAYVRRMRRLNLTGRTVCALSEIGVTSW
jgi:hypothetical protein